MKKYIIIGVIIILAFFGFGVSGFYSSMVEMDENLLSLDNQIQNMYSRRADLIPQIAGIVKAAANFEGSTIKDVTALRGASQNISKLEQLKSSGSLSSPEFSMLLMATMNQMKLMSEQYPSLQSISGYKDMTVTVEGSENRLRTAIKDYNDSIASYNTKLRSFPYGILFGNALGFKKKDRTYTASETNQTISTAVPNTTDLLK